MSIICLLFASKKSGLFFAKPANSHWEPAADIEKSTHLGAFSCSAAFRSAFLRSGESCVQLKKENMTNTEESSEETRLTTVIWVLIEGPAVSLKGSPTVSPMTAAL